MSTPRRQENQHYVVTGAGTGIGRAIAVRLASEGAILSLMARDTDRLRQTAELALSGGSPGVEVFGCDIRDGAQVDRAFEASAAALGPLRGLVANAGIGGANTPGAEDRFDDLVATNLTGTYACLRAAEKLLADGPAPRHLLVTSSILARIGVAGYTGYCASKAGLLGLVRALAMELAPAGVQVNAICPGWVDTDMATQGLQGMAAAMGIPLPRAREIALDDVPLKRMSRPEEIAGTVAWLLSPDGRGATGQAFDINGGAFMI